MTSLLRWTVGVLLLGCTTGRITLKGSQATIPLLATTYPVSASSSYLDSRGVVVAEDRYRVVQSFRFEKTRAMSIFNNDTQEIRLEPDLDRIMKEAPGDAVTRFSFVAELDASGTRTASRLSYGTAVLWPMSLLLFTSGGVLAEDNSFPSARGLSKASFALGAITGVAGVVLLVVGMTRSNEWRINASGQVVKARGPEASSP